MFIDIDPVRPKGISSTDAQLEEARAVADAVEHFLATELDGDDAIARGCSGIGQIRLVLVT